MSGRDYILGATTSCMARDYAGKIAGAEAALSGLKNQNGGYAADIRDCIGMYREIEAIVAKYAAMKRAPR